MRKLLLVAVACMTLFVTALFAGPISSGAWLLLLPTPRWGVEHDLPPDYEPLHKGAAYLATGMYSREKTAVESGQGCQAVNRECLPSPRFTIHCLTPGLPRRADLGEH